jgi:hypothetical protein
MIENELNMSIPVHASLVESAKEAGIESVDDPQWDSVSWFGWQRYVPPDLRDLWSSLSMETRVAVALTAKARADAIDVD